MTDIVDPVHHGEAERWGGWSWREATHGEHFRRCSYCGSINPDDLAAEPEWRADWADRKYGWPHKFYVNIRNRNLDDLFVIGTMSGGDRKAPKPGYMGLDWHAWVSLTPEQREICERSGHGRRDDLPDPGYVGFGTREVHHAKFYSVHLADPTISTETREAIARHSGLRFEWLDDGRVAWKPYQDTEA